MPGAYPLPAWLPVWWLLQRQCINYSMGLKIGSCTLRPFSVVESIIYDDKAGKATGVRVIDTNTKEAIEYYAKVIFVNAAALNTNLILLNSTSHRFPNGLGNDSGVLGKYVAFHNYSAHISAEYDGFKEWTTDGRNPAGGGYIPRFVTCINRKLTFYAVTHRALAPIAVPTQNGRAWAAIER
jgi:choline dehydrogenase-like flavoprotein